jgi:hypothetical protein
MVQGHNTRSAINAYLRPQWLLGVLTAALLAAPVYSQSLGDIARQELERKQSQPRRTTHTYDNDDLARPQILLPEDRDRVRASKNKVAPNKVTPPASETAEESGGKDQKPNPLPASDIAQHYQASEADPRPPKPPGRALQPMLVAPSSGNWTPSQPPVRHAASPIPFDAGGHPRRARW